jgi:hypothetical protein
MFGAIIKTSSNKRRGGRAVQISGVRIQEFAGAIALLCFE